MMPPRSGPRPYTPPYPETTVSGLARSARARGAAANAVARSGAVAKVARCVILVARAREEPPTPRRAPRGATLTREPRPWGTRSPE